MKRKAQRIIGELGLACFDQKCKFRDKFNDLTVCTRKVCKFTIQPPTERQLAQRHRFMTLGVLTGMHTRLDQLCQDVRVDKRVRGDLIIAKSYIASALKTVRG